VNFTKG
jgi:hypothetical protein